MADLIERQRESRKNPSVLKHKLISVRSVRPDVVVFIFEGDEDIGVYETWVGRMQTHPAYESIAGKGKEQLLGLRDGLLSDHPSLLRRVHFFVDCDFDAPIVQSDDLFVLDGYSIENFLCSPESLESLLLDEFRCAGSPEERVQILEKFENAFSAARQCLLELNFGLFLARRTGTKVIKKPDDVSKIIKIGVDSITPVFSELGEILQLGGNVDAETIAALRDEFSQLSDRRSQRGKYVLSVFRGWLKALAEDRKKDVPTCFSRSMPALGGEPWTVPMRRLASTSPLPNGLDAFVSRASAIES